MKWVVAFLLFASAVSVAWASGPQVTPDEYQLYMDWVSGKDDERLAKLSESDKEKKIAKSLGVTQKVLQAAIAKVTPLAASLADDSKKAVFAAADGTPLKGRVVSVDIDAAQGHVVAGVKWKCGDARDTDKEAAFVAWAVSDGAPVVKTLALWCVDGAEQKLFSAKIGRAAFEKISKDQIDRFATSRYIKFFEEVKRGPHT